MTFNLRPLFRLFLPFGLVAAAILILLYGLSVKDDYLPLFLKLPYGFLATVVGLACYFNRSRILVAALLLATIYWLIHSQLQTALDTEETMFIYSSISIFSPLILSILTLAPERGIWNKSGLSVLLLLPLSLIVCAWAYANMEAIPIASSLLLALEIKPHPDVVISTTAAIWFAANFILCGLSLWFKNTETEASLLACLTLIFVTLTWFDQTLISTVMICTAGIILGIAIVRSSFEMAYRDDLTGLLGRRALNERLRSLGKRYTIAMMDIDHFKKFNDVYGHDVGDEVLKVVANHIAKTTGGGTAYRYGGEEFCVIFPGKKLKPCVPHLQAIREEIADHRVLLRDKKTRPKSSKEGEKRRGSGAKKNSVSVTISIGVAERDDKKIDSSAVLKAADKALYRSKQNGRNCLTH